MRVFRHRRAQRFENVDLARGVVDVVFAADHMGDFHVPVIDDDAEVIGWRTIGAADDQIVQLTVAEFDRAANFVVENHRPFLRVAEAHHVRLVVGVAALAVAAVAVVTRLLAVFHLLLAQRFRAFLGAIAFIGRALLQHFVDDRVVAIETLGLEVRAFIPIQFNQFMPSIIASIASRVERSKSVSSIRRTNSPPAWRLNNPRNKVRYARRRREDSRSGSVQNGF